MPLSLKLHSSPVVIIYILSETVGDNDYHQVTIGLNESDRTERTTVTICNCGTQIPISKADKVPGVTKAQAPEGGTSIPKGMLVRHTMPLRWLVVKRLTV